MAAHTTDYVIEQLEEDLAYQKEENNSLANRLIGMVDKMAQNRIAAKNLLDERDNKIALLEYNNESMKDQLNGAYFKYERKCEEMNNLIKQEEYYITVMNNNDETIAKMTKEINNLKKAYSNAQTMVLHFSSERDILKDKLQQARGLPLNR